MATERLQRGEPIRKRRLKDGTIRWVVRMDVGTKADGSRNQISSTWKTLKEARNEVARIRTQLNLGTYVQKAETTVEGYLEQWLHGQHRQKRKTVLGYRSALKVVTDAYGQRPLQSLTKRDLDVLVTDMLSTGGRKGQGRSARTVSLMLTILSAALESATKEQRLAVNVAALVAKPRDDFPTAAGAAWTAQQALTYLVHVADDRYAAAWRLSLYGLRRGEVLGLTWSAVNFEKATVTVGQSRVVAGREVIISSTKTRQVRTIKVGPEVVADLRSFKALQATERLAAGAAYADSGLIVVNELGVPMRPERYSDLFQKHRAAAELPRIRLHDLRHTTASLLHSLGLPPAACAKYLGHTVEVYLRIYAHLYAEDEDATAAGLSALYSSAERDNEIAG